MMMMLFRCRVPCPGLFVFRDMGTNMKQESIGKKLWELGEKSTTYLHLPIPIYLPTYLLTCIPTYPGKPTYIPTYLMIMLSLSTRVLQFCNKGTQFQTSEKIVSSRCEEVFLCKSCHERLEWATT